MKKTIALLLSALLLLGALAGCGRQPEAVSPDAQESATPAPAETPAPSPEAAETDGPAASPDGSVIFDKDGVTVTTAGLDQDPTDMDPQPIIWVDVVNSGDRDAYLGVMGGSVNGLTTTVVLVDFYIEDGEYYGASYDTEQTVGAGESKRFALSYYKKSVPGVDMDTLAQMEFCFATSEDEYSWYNYFSEPVTIVTGEESAPIDIAALGTVVIDNEKLRLVIGEQDWDDWSGPEVYVYAENKSERYLGVAAETAEADGVFCDYLYYATAVAPGKLSADVLAFDGEIREMRGFEELTLVFSLSESDSPDTSTLYDGEKLDPVTVTYPPRIWGDYENGGLRFEVQPKYNDLITVETPENDPDGILFKVSETASLEAGGYDGAGWLFSVGRIGEDELHQLLCEDMSGMETFAKDEENNYYIWYHPTDVRFERASAAEMESGMAQWSMLCEWAEAAKDSFRDKNGLENASFSNTPVDIYLSRAAWRKDAKFTLGDTSYGTVGGAGVDAAPYVEYLLQHYFFFAEPEYMDPDFEGGEFVELAFPEEDVRIEFYYAEGGYVRFVCGDTEQMYQAAMESAEIRDVEAMQGWYYACCEAAGLKPKDDSLTKFCGVWYDKIAGRGEIEIEPTVAPNKAQVNVRWPESAAVVDVWEIVATLSDSGELVYDDGYWESLEFDEDGESWQTDGGWEQSGSFSLVNGELIWRDDHEEHGGESTFIR